MERLTKRTPAGVGTLRNCTGCPFAPRCPGVCVDQDKANTRLADYEDTGLTPDEITEMANDIETRFIRYIEKTYGQDAGELLRIWEAAKDGRVVILPAPAKEGDPKPDCFYNDNAGLWCNGMGPVDGDEPAERCKQCWYCLNGYAAEEGDHGH